MKDLTFDDILRMGGKEGRALLQKIMDDDMKQQVEKQRAVIRQKQFIKRAKENAMKRFLMTIIFVFITSTAWATPFLVCDVPTGFTDIERSDVKIDGVILEGIAQLGPGNTYVILYDLVGFASGDHVMEARFIHISGWPGDWSAPLNAGKPATPGGVRIMAE